MAKNKNITRYYGNNRASKVIYGAILLFVTIVGLHSLKTDTAFGLGITTLMTAITIVFAEIYSEIIGERIKNRGKLSSLEKQNIISDSLSIASISIWPSIFFFISMTGLYSVEIAFNLSYLYLLGILLSFCYLASRLSGVGKLRSWLFAGLNVCVGLVVILLKYLASH